MRRTLKANGPLLVGAVCLLVVMKFVTRALASESDSERGSEVFKTQCSSCHSDRPQKNLIGPSLFGVVGRQAGQVRGFLYSPANRESGIIWEPETLDEYLTAPQIFLPGTFMTYPGLKDSQKRSDLVEYLKSLH